MARSRAEFRPGHADYTYAAKYGVRDYQRRRAAPRRARPPRAWRPGAVARVVLGEGVAIRAALVQVGPHGIDRDAMGLGGDPAQPLLVPGRRNGRAMGGRISTACARRAPPPARSWRCRPRASPAGWGAPVYGKLDAELAGALMSINAVKGVEIGDGFAAAASVRAKRTPTRCGRATDGPVFRVQPCRRRARRHLHGPDAGRTLGAEADLLDPDAAGLAGRERGLEVEVRTTGRHDPVRRPARRARGGGDDGLRAR